MSSNTFSVRRLLIIVTSAIAAAAIASSTAGLHRAEGVQAQRPVALGGLFAHVTTADAEAAADGSAWLALVGQRGARRPRTIEVLHIRADGSRVRAPRLGVRPAADQRVALALDGNRPCLGFTVRGRGQVRCLSDGAWHRLPGLMSRHRAGLVQIHTAGRRLHALLVSGATTRRYEVLRWNRGRWTRLGHAFPESRNALALLGQRWADGRSRLQLGVTAPGNRGSGRRYVADWTGRRWRSATAISPLGELGSQTSGPVSVGDRVLFARVNAQRRPWSFFAESADPGGRLEPLEGSPLNQGVGDAQGRLSFAAGTVCAIWQEHRVTRSGWLGAVFVAPLEGEPPRAGAVTRLWSGSNHRPSDVEVVELGGVPYALFMRARADGALRPSLVPIRRTVG